MGDRGDIYIKLSVKNIALKWLPYISRSLIRYEGALMYEFIFTLTGTYIKNYILLIEILKTVMFLICKYVLVIQI